MSITPTLTLRTLALPSPGRYQLQRQTCVAEIAVGRGVLSTVRRRAVATAGDLVIDRHDPLASWVRVDFDAHSVDLPGLDADGAPVIRFESTLVDETAAGQFVVRGDLYAGDFIIELALDTRIVSTADRNVAFAATTLINLDGLGIRRPLLMGRAARITVGADFVRRGATR